MAYRQLCAVTFAVIGWVAVGCGSGSGRNAAPDAIDEHPPGNSDQPINNAADHAPYPEHAPINPDQPRKDSGIPPSPPSAGGESGNDDNQGPPCSQARGCVCGNPCLSCTCQAGTDGAALAACLADDCAP